MESRTQGSRPRTQKNFDAKDRPFRGQGHRRKCSPKKKKKKVLKIFFRRSQKKGLQKFFSGEKGLQAIFSGDFYLRKPKKRSLQIFHQVSGVFQRNFNCSKIVLSSSRGQGNFRRLEASRPRTSKCVLEAKDVLEDSTSVHHRTILLEFVSTIPYKVDIIFWLPRAAIYFILN